jgi:hypothetical protein
VVVAEQTPSVEKVRNIDIETTPEALCVIGCFISGCFILFYGPAYKTSTLNN